MREKLQELYEKIGGREVFIIGGGPSFNLIDKGLLKNKNVICINNAYKEFKTCTAIYWCDESWIANHYDNIMRHDCKLRFTGKHFANNHISKNILGTGNSCVLKRTGDFGYDSNVDNVRGNNSGCHAINLCVNMKARKIVLLGYDMKMQDRKSHFHEGHGLPMSNYIYNDLFIPSIESMAAEIKKKEPNIEIVNCSHDTALRCFKRDKLENII